MEGQHPVERIRVTGVRYAPVQSRLNSPQSVKVSGEPVEVRLRAVAGLCLPIDEAGPPSSRYRTRDVLQKLLTHEQHRDPGGCEQKSRRYAGAAACVP
jgi:hypothetical protein